MVALVGVLAAACATKAHEFTVTNAISTTDATVHDQTGWVRGATLIIPFPEWALENSLPHVKARNVTPESVDVRWTRGDCDQSAWVDVAGDSPDKLRISVYQGEPCLEQIGGYGVLRLAFDRPIDARTIEMVELTAKPVP